MSDQLSQRLSGRQPPRRSVTVPGAVVCSQMARGTQPSVSQAAASRRFAFLYLPTVKTEEGLEREGNREINTPRREGKGWIRGSGLFISASVLLYNLAGPDLGLGKDCEGVPQAGGAN